MVPTFPRYISNCGTPSTCSEEQFAHGILSDLTKGKLRNKFIFFLVSGHLAAEIFSGELAWQIEHQ